MTRHIYVFMIILGVAVLSNSAGIQIGQNEGRLGQKKKSYCKMISYHFLDDFTSVFEQFTKGMNSLKSEVFRNRVANRLAQNCEVKITTQQVIQLARLVQSPKGHQQQIQDIQNKYVEYFAPEDGIVLQMLESVKRQSDQEASKQLQKYHEARRLIESSSENFVKGFKMIQKHINETGHKILQSYRDLTNAIGDIHTIISDTVQKLKSHPEVKKIKEFFEDL